jgi:hypothetical protein
MRHYAVAIAAAASLASCNRADDGDAAAPTYVKAHDIKQLMATIVQPQADVFWRSSGSVMDEQGEHDLTPTTEERWLAARSASATVAEMGNLLQTPLYAEGRGADWIQFSKALVEIGMRAEQAVAARNSDAMFEVGGTMYNVCSACHQAYPPAAGEVPGQAPGNQAE